MRSYLTIQQANILQIETMLKPKRIIKFSFFYLLLLLFVGCKLQKDLFGVYFLEADGELTHKLHIHQDGSFDYSIKGSLIDAVTEGFWEIDSMGFLVLKSHENLKPGLIKSEEFKVGRTGRFFKIVDSEGLPLLFSSIVSLQDTSFHVVTNEVGEIYIDDNAIKDLEIYFLGEKFEYSIKSHYADSVVLFLQLRNPEFFYLENERFQLKNKKLVRDSSILVFKRGAGLEGKY